MRKLNRTVLQKPLNNIACGVVLALFCQLVSGPLRAEAGPGGEGNLEELQKIGKTLSRAILDIDIDTILDHDRPDLFREDRMLLKDKASPLYCYLFDSDCYEPHHRSVYEIFRNARNLTVVAEDLGEGRNGIRYGLLYFFDEAIIDKRKLLSSPDYLCEKGGKEVVTWTFKYVNGKWVSSHPPFDAETDVHCNP